MGSWERHRTYSFLWVMEGVEGGYFIPQHELYTQCVMHTHNIWTNMVPLWIHKSAVMCPVCTYPPIGQDWTRFPGKSKGGATKQNNFTGTAEEARPLLRSSRSSARPGFHP